MFLRTLTLTKLTKPLKPTSRCFRPFQTPTTPSLRRLSTVNPPLPPSATLVESARLVTTTPNNINRPAPTMFSIHGLRSLPFWTAPDANSDNRIAYNDPYLKSVVDSLEANYDDIKAEYLEAVMGLSTSSTGLNDSKPMESDYVSTDTEHHLHKGNWEWHSYILKGGKSPSFAQRCPKTASLIDSFGDKLFGTPFSYCFFSTLHADSSIEAHCGAMNLRLRIHLPLIVPVEDVATNKCGIKVASQKRKWEEGKCIVLDDSYQHEVWNETSEARVVLLVDIWHPDVTKDERNSINEMFDYSAKMGWLKNSE